MALGLPLSPHMTLATCTNPQPSGLFLRLCLSEIMHPDVGLRECHSTICALNLYNEDSTQWRLSQTIALTSAMKTLHKGSHLPPCRMQLNSKIPRFTKISYVGHNHSNVLNVTTPLSVWAIMESSEDFLSRPASQNTLKRRRDTSRRRIYARKIPYVYALSFK